MIRSLSYKSLGQLQQDEMPLRKGDQNGTVEVPDKKRPRLKRRASLGNFFRRANSVPKKLGAAKKDENADEMEAWSTTSWGNAFSDSESNSKKKRAGAGKMPRRRLKAERTETPTDDSSSSSSSSSSSDCSSSSHSSDSQSESSSSESDRRAPQARRKKKTRQADTYFPSPKRSASNRKTNQSPEDSSDSGGSSHGSVTSSDSEGSDTRQHKQVLRGNMVPSKAFASGITSPTSPKGRVEIPKIKANNQGTNNSNIADDDELMADEDSSIESSMCSIPPPVIVKKSEEPAINVEDLNRSLHDIQTDKEEMTKIYEELNNSTRALESQLRETRIKKTRKGKASTSKEQEAELAAELQAMLDEKRDMADIIATLEKESREIESKICQRKNSDGNRQTYAGVQLEISPMNSRKSVSPVPPELKAMQDEKEKMADMIAKLQQETLEMENRLMTVQMKNRMKAAVPEPQQTPDDYDLHSDEESMTEIQPDDCNKSLSAFPSMHDLRQSISMLADDTLPTCGVNQPESSLNNNDDDDDDDDDSFCEDSTDDSSDNESEKLMEENSDTDEESSAIHSSSPGMDKCPKPRAHADPPSGDEVSMDQSELIQSNDWNQAHQTGELMKARVPPRQTKSMEGLETTKPMRNRDPPVRSASVHNANFDDVNRDAFVHSSNDTRGEWLGRNIQRRSNHGRTKARGGRQSCDPPTADSESESDDESSYISFAEETQAETLIVPSVIEFTPSEHNDSGFESSDEDYTKGNDHNQNENEKEETDPLVTSTLEREENEEIKPHEENISKGVQNQIYGNDKESYKKEETDALAVSTAGTEVNEDLKPHEQCIGKGIQNQIDRNEEKTFDRQVKTMQQDEGSRLHHPTSETDLSSRRLKTSMDGGTDIAVKEPTQKFGIGAAQTNFVTDTQRKGFGTHKNSAWQNRSNVADSIEAPQSVNVAEDRAVPSDYIDKPNLGNYEAAPVPERQNCRRDAVVPPEEQFSSRGDHRGPNVPLVEGIPVVDMNSVRFNSERKKPTYLSRYSEYPGSAPPARRYHYSREAQVACEMQREYEVSQKFQPDVSLSQSQQRNGPPNIWTNQPTSSINHGHSSGYEDMHPDYTRMYQQSDQAFQHGYGLSVHDQNRVSRGSTMRTQNVAQTSRPSCYTRQDADVLYNSNPLEQNRGRHTSVGGNVPSQQGVLNGNYRQSFQHSIANQRSEKSHWKEASQTQTGIGNQIDACEDPPYLTNRRRHFIPNRPSQRPVATDIATHQGGRPSVPGAHDFTDTIRNNNVPQTNTRALDPPSWSELRSAKRQGVRSSRRRDRQAPTKPIIDSLMEILPKKKPKRKKKPKTAKKMSKNEKSSSFASSSSSHSHNPTESSSSSSSEEESSSDSELSMDTGKDRDPSNRTKKYKIERTKSKRRTGEDRPKSSNYQGTHETRRKTDTRVRSPIRKEKAHRHQKTNDKRGSLSPTRLRHPHVRNDKRGGLSPTRPRHPHVRSLHTGTDDVRLDHDRKSTRRLLKKAKSTRSLDDGFDMLGDPHVSSRSKSVHDARRDHDRRSTRRLLKKTKSTRSLDNSYDIFAVDSQLGNSLSSGLSAEFIDDGDFVHQKELWGGAHCK